MRRKWRDLPAFLLFVLPAMIIFMAFYAYPILKGFVYAFTDWNSFLDTPSFVGFSNFRELASDEWVRTAMKNNLILTVVVVIMQNAFAVIFAVILNQKLKGMEIFRAVIFLPVLLSTAVISYIWSYMYSPLSGVIGPFMSSIGLDHLSKVDWLGDPKYSMLSISAVLIWEYTGYSMVIYLAGLKTIPSDLYEAGEIDGAGRWTQFRRITLPLLAPSITINSVIAVIGCLKQFDQVYLLTGGGPAHKTETFGTLIYNIAFQSQRLGYGTSIALVMTIGICIISAVQYAILSRREVHY
ncbi:carbohydrate ABC transporter permease [Paenibacillus wynnii]|uniref:carbohydrate ABC transporter permease n=1 Tax=Paenibacillus wynnii TaxID=268407 RepID=UPI00068EA6D3|nr:sugar ABC transporter permease [Paenibacillus wynnii]